MTFVSECMVEMNWWSEIGGFIFREFQHSADTTLPLKAKQKSTQPSHITKYSYSMLSYSLYRQDYTLWESCPGRLGNQLKNDRSAVLAPKIMPAQIHIITLRWYTIPWSTGTNYSNLVLWHGCLRVYVVWCVIIFNNASNCCVLMALSS